ncbi:MAG: PEP-CTERM-box response regulator transcription factor [Kiritimatiellae bacterium]|nr:PEP-CTERM-box response regulator transcription factor [Kiritimatiellia bacterium]
MKPKPKVLVVDDDESLRAHLKWALADGCEVFLAGDRVTASELLARQRPEVVLLDLGLPPHPNDPEEGFLALRDMQACPPIPKIIVITGQEEKQNALRAIGEGAYDFLSKPVDTEVLKIIVNRAVYVSRLEREYREMQYRFGEEAFEGMLGTSEEIQKIFSTIRKVAPTDVPVLVLGESGTGKEMAARAIHNLSPRRENPFVAINCSAIPATLLESELFGHEKGAFTGAHTHRIGRIESASGGTLFLDEIGELSPALQVKLLRFLQDGTIERVGARKPVEVDVRIIAATNTDLTRAMAENRFREDLYYRLAVVVFKLPPLRERREDILLLAKYFLRRFAAQCKREVLNFAGDAIRAMHAYSWPGNIREMENRIKRAVIMAEGREITAADLELGGGREGGQKARSLREARDAVEREMILDALRRSNGTISRAAEALEISRPTLYELMSKHGIERNGSKA